MITKIMGEESPWNDLAQFTKKEPCEFKDVAATATSTSQATIRDLWAVRQAEGFRLQQ